MRNILVILLSLICGIANTQQLQEWTSEFILRYGNYSDEAVKICVLVDIKNSNYKDATYVLATRFGGELLPCSVSLYGQAQLEQFYSDLKQIRDKYNEWLNVARQNGVRDLVKDIPFKTSQVELTLYDGNMNKLKTFNTQFKGVFRAEFNSLSLFPDSNSIRIGFSSVTGEDIPIFHVRSIADFDKILNALTFNKIKAKMESKIQKQNLFN